MFGCLLLSVGLSMADDANSAASEELVSLKQRTGIVSLHLQFTTVSSGRGAQEGKLEVSREVWMDGARTRVDTVSNSVGLGALAGRRVVECMSCERRGYYLIYYEANSILATLSPRAERLSDNKTSSPEIADTDFRIVGYVPAITGTLYSSRLDRWVGGVDRENVAVTDEDLDGAKCTVVRFRRASNKSRVSIWYDKLCGMHPVMFLIDNSASSDIAQLVRMRSTLQLVSKGKWFPRTIRYTEELNDKIQFEEEVIIKQVEIDQPIPNSTFTMAGIGVSDNTIVSVKGLGGTTQVWRGGKLVPYDEARKEWDNERPAPTPVSLAPAEPARYWLYALACVLALLAAVLALRAFRKTS